MKLIMRIIFCFVPAILLSGPFFIFYPSVGLAVLAAMFGLGWYATKTRSERGEGLFSDNWYEP